MTKLRVVVRSLNPSGTEFTMDASDVSVWDNVLRVLLLSGKTMSFPLAHVAWWSVVEQA